MSKYTIGTMTNHNHENIIRGIEHYRDGICLMTTDPCVYDLPPTRDMSSRFSSNSKLHEDFEDIFLRYYMHIVMFGILSIFNHTIKC